MWQFLLFTRYRIWPRKYAVCDLGWNWYWYWYIC